MDACLAHESLDVYRVALEFLALSEEIACSLPPGRAEMAQQLRAAALSIVLNIGEGYGKRAIRDRKRFYDIARGSAHECGCVLDAARALGWLSNGLSEPGKSCLVRIVSMLVKMSR